MLTVDHYEIIRRKVRDGMSQREVAKELGHSRNTIAKAIQFSHSAGISTQQARAKSVIEPFTRIIDSWFEADKKVRRKQRMLATKIHERLCNEYGFTGYYSTAQLQLPLLEHTNVTEI